MRPAAELLSRCERLRIVTRNRSQGLGYGVRRTRRRGSSLQFADFREYVAGDDPRQVDWNVYGRSGNLVVKQFEDESRMDVHILVDVSRSMEFGTPSKFDTARTLGGLLGHIALTGFDRVVVVPIDRVAGAPIGPLAAREQSGHVFQSLERWSVGGESDLGRALTAYVNGVGARPGVMILISDLMTPTWEAGLRALVRGHHQVAIVHLLAPEEVFPAGGEELRLLDRESGKTVEVHVDRVTLDAYARRFAEWIGAIEHFCHKHGARYARANSDQPLESLLFDGLRRRGVLT